MTTEYRAGILTVIDLFGRARMERGLPPEHRVAAVKPGDRQSEYLIEGPTLPVVAEGQLPQPVRLLITTTRDSDAITLRGAWEHAAEAAWQIGSWPDWISFQKFLDALS